MPSENLLTAFLQPDAALMSAVYAGTGLDPFPVQETTLGGGGDATRAFLNADQRTGIADNGKPSYTIDQAASQIIRGAPGWSNALGVGFTVSYAYRASAPTNMPDDSGGFQQFSAVQISQTELALQAWSDVANIRFTRVGSGTSDALAYSNSATILFANYTTGVAGAAAFGEFPGSTSFNSPAGDVWINSTFSYNTNPTVGNYGGQVLDRKSVV